MLGDRREELSVADLPELNHVSVFQHSVVGPFSVMLSAAHGCSLCSFRVL